MEPQDPLQWRTAVRTPINSPSAGPPVIPQARHPGLSTIGTGRTPNSPPHPFPPNHFNLLHQNPVKLVETGDSLSGLLRPTVWMLKLRPFPHCHGLQQDDVEPKAQTGSGRARVVVRHWWRANPKRADSAFARNSRINLRDILVRNEHPNLFESTSRSGKGIYPQFK
jgi:hypothetical protein